MGDLLGAFSIVPEGPVRVLFDALDVLLVAFLFYRTMLLVRGTRAMQMAFGMGLVFVLYFIARELRLVTLFAILDWLITYIVLLIVVVFQNDIRRALARAGQRPFFRAAANAKEAHSIEEVVKAAGALAQKKIGGLIVFERDAALDEFVTQGTPVDADVSRELLYSMFVPTHENPLHDGAVVIRDGRIWQAGAFLPLSGSAKLDRSLGTRHRAAIGISEETDAVVVVVSEERGNISICFNGNIARGLDAGSLRQALLGLFQKSTKKRESTGSSKVRGTDRPSSAGLSSPSISTAGLTSAAGGGTGGAALSSTGLSSGGVSSGGVAASGVSSAGLTPPATPPLSVVKIGDGTKPKREVARDDDEDES